jgi:hypothetical protein
LYYARKRGVESFGKERKRCQEREKPREKYVYGKERKKKYRKVKKKYKYICV